MIGGSSAEIPEAPPVLAGPRVYRIHWVLGTDQLRAVCHCGAERMFEEPVELWEWLLAHPDGHDPPDPPPWPHPAGPRAGDGLGLDPSEGKLSMRTPPHVEHELELVLEKKEAVADDVVRLVLRHPDGYELPAWAPGAHVDLVLAEGLVRQYSLCGDPDDLSTLHVAVLREEAGRGGSQHVHDELAEGDVVHVRGPRNHFPLVQADRYLFIAGGIGITPILPMIAQVEASGADWRLVYGGRTRSSMAFQAELQDRYPGKVVIHPQDEAGLLDLPTLLADPGATAVYCCGPEGAARRRRGAVREPAEGDTARRALRAEGRRRGRSPASRSRSSSRRPARCSPSRRTGPSSTSSRTPGCRCCPPARRAPAAPARRPSCPAIPDHRDSVLTDDEQAANDTMMICVSRSCSPRLVLDL